MGQPIQFPRPDGGAASGYLAEPAGGASAPGVIVIHEWWGLQDQIKGICDQYAADGYRALAPDLYDGKVATDAAEAESLMNQLDFIGATEQVVRGAAQFLKQGSPKVALTGYCMGGVVVLLGAARIPELDAAVCYYGIPPEAAFNPADVRIPVLGHFATRDTFFPIDRARDVQVKMFAAGVDAEFHEYEADHAFCNDRRPEVFDPDACELAYNRTKEFLARKIGP